MPPVRSSLIANRDYYQISSTDPHERHDTVCSVKIQKYRLYGVSHIYVPIFRQRNLYNDIKKHEAFIFYYPAIK